MDSLHCGGKDWGWLSGQPGMAIITFPGAFLGCLSPGLTVCCSMLAPGGETSGQGAALHALVR